MFSPGCGSLAVEPVRCGGWPGWQKLQIECRDDWLGTKWRAVKSWSAGSEPGVCVLSFEPVDI